jgi:serine/threonine-protein kinase
VIHRDLKPHNVFLAVDDSGEERAKLLDFGVSKIRDSRSLATTDARLIGTPSYMSPEQAEGNNDDVGPGTDVWAMGAMLYEMATGTLAFDGPNLPQILYRICTREPEPANKRRADAPPAFVDLLDAVMSRDAAVRIVDADVMRVRLREALRDVANVQYPEVMRSRSSAPALPVTPMPTAQPSTPRRRKRFTDALTDTLASGETPIKIELPPAPPGAADTVVATVPAGTLPPTTMPGAATLARKPRWGPWIGVAVGAALAIGATFAVMVAIRDPERRETSPPVAPAPAPAPAVAPAPAPPPAPAPAMVQIDAAPATEPAASMPMPRDPPAKRPPEKKVPKDRPEPVEPPPTGLDTTDKRDKAGAGSSAHCAAHPDDPMCAFGTDR